MSRLISNALIAVSVIVAMIVVQARAADDPGNIHTAQNVDHEKFEKKLQDVRENIDKRPGTVTSTPTGPATGGQAIDVCKVNPRLPQCKN